MTLKRFAARMVAVTTSLVLIAVISAGVYYDAGGWLAVAVVWGASAALMGLAWALAWGIDNWKAER